MSSQSPALATGAAPRARPSYRMLLLGAAALALLLALLVPAARFAICALLLLLAPGFLLESWLGLELPLLARPAVWIGVSISIVPVLYLWMPTLGLSLTAAWYMLAPLLAAGVVWRLWQAPPRLLPKGQGLSAALLATLAAIIALTAWTRAQHIRGLAFPVWVDSVHHALMIRQIIETGQPPFSLRPYLPVDNLTYHWGYHSVAAPTVLLSGLALPTAMLWIGQIINTLHAVALAGAAAALFRRPVAALGAAAVVGVVSIMPAFFVSWGRYTLLSGLLILPATMIVSWEWLRRPGWKGPAVLALLLAGMNMTHFVAFSFAALWCAVAWLTVETDQRWRLFGRLAAAGGASFLLTGPWIERLVRETLATQANGPMSLNGNETLNNLRDALGLLWTSGNLTLAALAAAAALLALRLRWLAAGALVLWAGLVLLAANPVWIGLPYLSFLNNSIMAMSFFVPLTLLLGGGVAALDDLAAGYLRRDPPPEAAAPERRLTVRGWRAARNLAILGFAIVRALNFRDVINRDTATATPDDLTAIAWVARHTPPDASFAVNTIPWNQYRVSRGSDGGWWLMPLIGRQVSTPPVVFFYGTLQYRNEVRARTDWLSNATEKSPAELADWMAANGYGYAYATEKGRVFDPAELAGAPQFELVYHEGRVWIYRLKPAS